MINGKAGKTIALLWVLIVFMLTAAVLPGCTVTGEDSPEGAVKALFEAKANRDWAAYTDVILPEDLRTKSPAELSLMKKNLEKAAFEYSDMRFEVVEGSVKGDYAEVSYGGIVKVDAGMPNEMQDTISNAQDYYEEYAEYAEYYGYSDFEFSRNLVTRKVDGKWYVVSIDKSLIWETVVE